MTLPNLLIAGFPKAGTGSMFAYLTQHPDVCGSTKKEVGFFTPSDPSGVRGPLDEYGSHFRCGEEPYRLEATPRYAYGGPRVRSAIARTLPDVRIILILRDPTDRLWSAYRFQRSLGHVRHATFDAYVSACERMLASGVDIHEQGHLKGLAIGMYGRHVPPWLAAFATDLRIAFFDDLARDPAAVVTELCRWLGIDPSPAGRFAYAKANATVPPRSVALAAAADRVRMAARDVVPAPASRLARKLYARVNAAHAEERPDPATLERVRGLYEDSNAELARALRGSGWTGALPPWLTSDAPSAAAARP